MAVSRAIEMVRKLIPDVDGRVSRFETDPFEVDDELLAVFCEELERLTGDLQTGLDTRDGKMIRLAAHSIKGMGGAMGLPEISVLAQEIELMLHSGQMERCTMLCNTLIDWSRDFIAANQRSL